MPRKRRTSSKAGSSKAGSSKAGSSNGGPTIDSLNNEIKDLRVIVEDGLINQKEATEHHMTLLLERIHDNKVEHRALIDANIVRIDKIIEGIKVLHAAIGKANHLRKANQLRKTDTRSHTKTPQISGEALDMYQG